MCIYTLSHNPSCCGLNMATLGLIKESFCFCSFFQRHHQCHFPLSVLSHFFFPSARFSVSDSLNAATPHHHHIPFFLSWFWRLFFFWCSVFAPWAPLDWETSTDQSFMAPRSLLHQKLWFASASTAAIGITISSYSTGASAHRRFLNIARDLKKKQAHLLEYAQTLPTRTHSHTFSVSCAFYSLFTSPAFAVT